MARAVLRRHRCPGVRGQSLLAETIRGHARSSPPGCGRYKRFPLMYRNLGVALRVGFVDTDIDVDNDIVDPGQPTRREQ